MTKSFLKPVPYFVYLRLRLFTIPLVLILANTLTGKNPVSLGIDHLEQIKFSILKEKRVGLLTHPAGRNGKGISTVEVFRDSKDVELVALFGPEHGIYGDEKASVPVEDKIDNNRLPIFSLYGKFRKPTEKCFLRSMFCYRSSRCRSPLLHLHQLHEICDGSLF